MQVGQRLAVIEPAAGRHEAVEKRQHAVGAVGKGPQDLMRVDARTFAAFVQPCLGARGFLRGRKKQEGQEVARHKMRARFLEIGLSLSVDQTGCRIGKATVRIGAGLVALRLDEDAPAQSKSTEGVVDAAGDGDQLGRDGGIEIGTSKPGSALERAVLVEHDAGSNESDPGQIVGET